MASPHGAAVRLITPAQDSAMEEAANAVRAHLVDASGSAISSFGGGTQYTEDAAAAADPTGTQLIARRRDSLSTETTTDGDNTAVNSTGKGELYVKHVDSVPVTDNGGSLTVDGTVAATQSGTWNVGTVTTVTNVVHVDDNSSSLTVDDGGGSLTVDGTVGVSGTVTVDSELPAAAALADATANPTVPIVGGAALLYNGTTWDRVRGDTTNGIDVDVTRVGGNVTVIQNTASSLKATVVGTGTLAVQDSQVIADNAGFTDGTSKVFMSGFIFDETAGTALTENDAAAARIDSKRSLVGVIEDATTRGQRAAVLSNGQLVVAARPQYASAGAALTITLTSLGATSARESTSVDNSSNLYKDALVLAVLKSNGVSANDTVAYIYVAGVCHDGTSDVWPDAVTGSDAAITLDSPTQLRLLGVVNFGAAGAAAATKKGGPWSVASAFGGTMPKKWSIVVQNNNAALTATSTDHKVIYQGVNA